MSHFGLGGVLGSILMMALLAVAVIVVVRMVMRKNAGDTPAPAAYSGTNATVPNFDNNASGFTPEIGSRINSAPSFQPLALQGAAATAGGSVPWGIPADFDVPGFVRSAKTYFIRLQLQERGASPNNTDVVQLDGELMGIKIFGRDHLASVKFTDLIKEVLETSAEPFTEVWNSSKSLSGQSGWVLAGIQQVAA